MKAQVFIDLQRKIGIPERVFNNPNLDLNDRWAQQYYNDEVTRHQREGYDVSNYPTAVIGELGTISFIWPHNDWGYDEY